MTGWQTSALCPRRCVCQKRYEVSASYSSWPIHYLMCLWNEWVGEKYHAAARKNITASRVFQAFVTLLLFCGRSTQVFVMTGWYPCVKKALIERGWTQNPDRDSPFFDLKWTLHSQDIRTTDIESWQLCNHFFKVFSIIFFPLCRFRAEAIRAAAILQQQQHGNTDWAHAQNALYS